MPTDEANERLRIHVPKPDVELQMGRTENGFIGIIARVESGGVFIAAGGYPFSIPSAANNYADFRKAQITLAVGVNGIITTANLLRSVLFAGSTDLLPGLFGLIPPAIMVSTVALAIKAGVENEYSAPGNVSIYGDMNVNMVSPLACSITSGISTSISAGVTASLNAVGTASVHGIFCSMSGLWSSSISGRYAGVLGDAKAVLAARDGYASIQGETIEVGLPSLIGNKAYAGTFQGGQVGTNKVHVRANKMILLEPGKATDTIAGTPTKITATKSELRLDSTAASVVVDGSGFVAHSGRAVLDVSSSGVAITQGKAPIKKTVVDTVMKPAEVAWKAAIKVAEATTDAVDATGWVMLGAAAAALGASIPAAIKLTQIDNQKPWGMLSLPIGLVGGAIGGLSAFGIVKLVEKVLTDSAVAAAKAAADTAYKTAISGAGIAEKTAIAAAFLPVNPRIEVNDSGITLSYGLNKLAVTAAGIEINTMPGAQVTVNGHTFQKGVMANLTVMA